jgi:NAD(P)H-flavin reductase
MASTTDKKQRSGKLVDSMIPRPFVIEKYVREADDTFTVHLEPLDPLDQLVFKPGQFNMVYIFGVGEVPMSISGDPGRTDTLVHTTREVGIVTRAMHNMKVGQTVGIRGPFGTTWPLRAAEGHDIVLVAGGIGLAPLRPALYHILANRESYGRVAMLYGTRTPDDILYAKELARWRAQFDLDVLITVDRATEDWRGSVGVVTNLISRAPFDPTETFGMVCGPEIMMRFSVQELQTRGVPSSSIYVSMERNMKCGIGKCGHCQLRGEFVCKDGPVYSYDKIEPLFMEREL